MQPEDLIRLAPTVFHMAPEAAWRSIQARGLLTSEQLLALHGVEGADRERILRTKRAKVVTLEHPDLPPAWIRDQKPMKFLEDKISADSTVEQYLTAINTRVFFWADTSRLGRLLAAREYRNQPQVVLHVDTAKLLAAYGERVELCRFNSGAITQRNHPVRGHRSWIQVVNYPYEEYRSRYGSAHALAEVTVVGGVPDVLDLAVMVEFTVDGTTPVDPPGE